MLITDLFSHKIHSSGDDWPEKLIDIATIFNKFDGHIYDRMAIEEELLKISPRSTKIGRDPSKFRDEISAYPAYLGLYRLELINGKWHIFLSKAAKRFLVNEEPNVAAFLLIQLVVFQYPNGMGIAYKSGSDSLRIQANTKKRTLDFIQNKIHLSPIRLICKVLLADSVLRNVSLLEAEVSYEEIFLLANNNKVNIIASPEDNIVIEQLNYIRANEISFPAKFESRFHILKHTDFFEVERSSIKLKRPITRTEQNLLLDKFRKINEINIQFNGFDNIITEAELLNKIKTSSWSNYFDAIKSLDQETINLLTKESDIVLNEMNEEVELVDNTTPVEIISSDRIYSFREFNNDLNARAASGKVKKYVDPELTKIKRQRANLTHKVLLEKLNDYLIKNGAKALENEHIDLYAQLPNNKNFIFEVKSIDEFNLLSQTRKGISQLYEYRYRYQNLIGYDVGLCLVYPFEPKYVPWLQEYLCKDREIGIMWFEDNKPVFSMHCDYLGHLI